MKRMLEPELMEEEEQGLVYAQADFSGPNTLFLDLFAENFPHFSGKGTVLDLGCGPADILIRFARKYPGCTCVGIDGAEAMLAPGHLAVEQEQLGHRITLHCQCLPCAALSSVQKNQENQKAGQEGFQVILSNSLLHHLHTPAILWQTIQENIAPEGLILVMDLFRPTSPEEARHIVKTYAADEPAILQKDFYNSLLAAFDLDEVRTQLTQAGLALHCEKVSDRHFAVWGGNQCLTIY
ncbi:MAG: class I SAM-dependent methyltransferase [Candidatus Electrothrix sp. AU1_5]|nr:class I SAM-dependent methyltransferase [Candidatus Electrothrix gigas]